MSEETVFGINLVDPQIKNMDDYTTYLTALQVKGKELPAQSTIEEAFYQYRESSGSSGINPNDDRKEKPVQPDKKTYKVETIITAFYNNLNHNFRTDFKKIKDLGGYLDTDLIKYRKLVNGTKQFFGVGLHAEGRFLEHVVKNLNSLKDNIKLLDSANCNAAIDKTVQKITDDFFTEILPKT